MGRAIRSSGIPREEIFVTTKLWNADQGFREGRAAMLASLDRLEMEYVDLYLIHWPIQETRRESWRALESLHAEKRARSIGVSNFLIPHLEDLLAHAEIVPAVNQVECHPFGYDRDLWDYCRLQGIAIQAYAPLARGTRLDDPTVLQLAETHEKSAAQILLRWSLQHGHIVLPKSVRRERIEANAAIFDFELSDEEMRRLDDLEEGLHTCWDPRNVD